MLDGIRFVKISGVPNHGFGICQRGGLGGHGCSGYTISIRRSCHTIDGTRTAHRCNTTFGSSDDVRPKLRYFRRCISAGIIDRGEEWCAAVLPGCSFVIQKNKLRARVSLESQRKRQASWNVEWSS